MINLKTKADIQGLRDAGKIVALTFRVIEPLIQPGIDLQTIDKEAEKFLISEGAEPLYKGIRQRQYQRPFPGVICTSVNSQICHGIPDGRKLSEGDIVGIDIGLRYKGWCGDACVTFAVGKINSGAQNLMDTAKHALKVGIDAAKPENRIGAIGAAIEKLVRKAGYSVVREYGGHGIGKNLWEEPFIPHIGPAERGEKLQPGMVINIEPMINAGKADTRVLQDEWTVVTADGSLSAQFEHMVAITENGPEILSKI